MIVSCFIYLLDEFQIVEHLVAIQTMSSEGIKWQNAQQALFLFDTDTESVSLIDVLNLFGLCYIKFIDLLLKLLTKKSC